MKNAEIEFTKDFRKSYDKYVRPNHKLKKAFERRLTLFLKGVRGYPLYDHQLVGGMAGLRAFSVTGDIRVIYEQREGTLLFLAIGTHAQVYT